MSMTFERQIEALGQFVDDWAIKKDKNVKGLFTSGDYVTWKLSQIFTPAGWSLTILDGPQVVNINEANAYVRLVGRLIVRFANGMKIHQDDIGIWPLRATGIKEGGTLETTAAERYETVEKAARTDCLKNAARNLGICFAPMTDLELQEAIKREKYLAGQSRAATTTSAVQDAQELFGDDAAGQPQEGAAGASNARRPPVSKGQDWTWLWSQLFSQGITAEDAHDAMGMPDLARWFVQNEGKTMRDLLAELLVAMGKVDPA